MFIINPILSPKNFENKNSIILFNEFNLDFYEIPENFFQIFHAKKLFFLNLREKIGKKESPINLYEIYSKKFASSAIIHHELSKRREITFLIYEKPIIFLRKDSSRFHQREANRDEMSAYALRKNQIDFYKALLRD